MAFTLSSQNLSFIERLVTIETFTFKTNKKRYLIPRCIAVFLSPKVFSIIKQNATNTELELKTRDDDDVFEQIIQLGYGKQIYINDDNRKSLLSFAQELENKELIDACTNIKGLYSSPSSLTLKNAIPSLKSKITFGANVTNDINFVADHFFEFDQKDLYTLDHHTLKRILSHPSLSIRNENTLFNFVFDLVSVKGRTYQPLFEFIHFEDIGVEEIARFVNAFNASSLSEPVWRSIGRRLTAEQSHLSVPPSPSPIPRKKSKERKTTTPLLTHEDITEDAPNSDQDEAVPTPKKGRKVIATYNLGSDPFKGVLSSMQNLKGKVAISASSKNTGFLSKLVKHGNMTNFWTHNEPDSWIRIDFKKNSLVPTCYSLAGRCDHDFNQMQSWVFEVLSQKTWIVLDEHKEQPLITKKPFTFKLPEQSNAYKSFRIRQTGPNTYGDNDLVLSRIELFGTLVK